MPPRGSKGFTSEAQREAAKRNLRKGNPNAYSKDSPQGETETPAAAASKPAKAKTQVIRARTSSPKPREPSPPATPPPAALREPAVPRPPQAKKHFLDDVLEGIFK